MRNDKLKRSDDWWFPPDLATVLAPFVLILGLLYLDFGISMAKRFGDTSLFQLGLLFGLVGVVLLFFARLPLYRQRRFFTLGPRALTGVNRKLYYAAYIFLVPSVVLLAVLLAFVR